MMKKFNTEGASIDYLVNYLKKSGYTDIHATQLDNQFEHYDVTATHPLGYKYQMEVKRRYHNHDKYLDTVVESTKFFSMLTDVYTNKIDGAWVVTMFNDIWTVSNAITPIFHSRHLVDHTTEFGDKTKVWKDFLHYNLQKKFEYENEKDEII